MSHYEQPPWAEITTSDGEEWETNAVVRGKHELRLDESSHNPFGNDSAPSPGDYLMIATAGCQVEVLKQCFEKARIGEYDIHMRVEREWERPDPDEVDMEPYPHFHASRYDRINMELSVQTTEEFEGRVRRCLDVCEDACVVSRTVEEGLEINLTKALDVTE